MSQNTQAETEWTPELGIIEVQDETQPQSPKGETFSLFEDDEGDSLYSGTVLLDGQKVRVRELSAAEMTIYSKGERELAQLMQSMDKIKAETEAEVRADEIKECQRALWNQVLRWAVSGWELKRPDGSPVECTPENKAKLRASKKAELCDKIIQRSSMGRDLTNFLAES